VSLRARFGLAAGAAVAVAVVAVAAASYEGNRSELYSQIDQSLTRLAAEYADNAGGDNDRDNQPHSGPGAAATFQPFPGTAGSQRHGGGLASLSGDCDQGLGINAPPNQAFGGATGFVQLLEPSGAVCRGTGESSAEIPVSPRARAVASAQLGRFFTTMTVKGNHIRVLVAGLPGYGALMLAWPLADVDRNLRSQLLLLGLVAAGGVALAALLGILVAQTALAPIARFTRQTEAIAVSPEMLEHERLSVEGDDELARLARTFNGTLDALESSVQAQRNLVADASHELRTPIATLRANLQLMRDAERLPEADRAALRTDMIEELDELTRLVSDVVELARGAKPDGEPGELRLDEIVAEALERARRRAPGLEFRARLAPALVHGDGERIARAVSNLLDNAVKWSPPAGAVEVSLDGSTLTVRDRGPGFGADDLPFVFDRFHRARDARAKPGSGLGLAIVKQAAEAHGGFAEASNAPDGGAILRVGFGEALELEEGDGGDAATPPPSGAERGGTPELRR
jgi:two-component system, OmpR family, sensor histidine kinase MprB